MAGTLHGRVTNVLHERTVVERAATLHENASDLCALHEGNVVHARVEVGALCEGHCCEPDTPYGGVWHMRYFFCEGDQPDLHANCAVSRH